MSVNFKLDYLFIIIVQITLNFKVLSFCVNTSPPARFLGIKILSELSNGMEAISFVCVSFLTFLFTLCYHSKRVMIHSRSPKKSLSLLSVAFLLPRYYSFPREWSFLSTYIFLHTVISWCKAFSNLQSTSKTLCTTVGSSVNTCTLPERFLNT